MNQQTTNTLTGEILALEQEAWQALCTKDGAGYYRSLMTPDAWMAFPFGVLEREEAIAGIEAAEPWEAYAIDKVQVARREETAVITYHATARRQGQDEYRAWMSSVYVRGEGEWRLLFHQQSPEMDPPGR